MNSWEIARDAWKTSPDTAVCRIRVTHASATPGCCRFEVVQEEGPASGSPLTVSSSFSALWYGGTIVQTQSAQAAFDEVVRALAEAGWEELDARDGNWYQRCFRRTRQRNQKWTDERTERAAGRPRHQTGDRTVSSGDLVGAGAGGALRGLR